MPPLRRGDAQPAGAQAAPRGLRGAAAGGLGRGRSASCAGSGAGAGRKSDEDDDDDDDEWLERAPASRPTPKPAGKRPRDDDDEDDDDDNGWPTPSRAANRVTTSGRRAPAAAEIIVLDETQDDAAMAPRARRRRRRLRRDGGERPRAAAGPGAEAGARAARIRPRALLAEGGARAPRARLLAGADTGAGAASFSLAERAPPASPTGAELAAMFPAEGDTVEIIWQKDTTLEVDGAGDRCIVASLRGPFPDKKKKRRSSTSLPAHDDDAELRSLVRLAGDQEHAFERVDETDRRARRTSTPSTSRTSARARGRSPPARSSTSTRDDAVAGYITSESAGVRSQQSRHDHMPTSASVLPRLGGPVAASSLTRPPRSPCRNRRHRGSHIDIPEPINAL